MSLLRKDLADKLAHHTDWPVLSHEERTRFLTLALCGEVGEMSEAFGHLMTDYLKKEIADVAIYFHMLCGHLKRSPRIYREKSLNAIHGTSMNLGLDIVEATGKLANLVKKSWRGDFDLERDRASDLNECIYRINQAIFDFAMHFDLDLQQIMLDKITEVEQREIFLNRHKAA
jgi:NTP pyrophosphatase (non-canonical NTP hydrolase)